MDDSAFHVDRIAEENVEITCKQLRFAIDNSSKLVFGSIGSAKIDYDILDCAKDCSSGPSVAILRVKRW